MVLTHGRSPLNHSKPQSCIVHDIRMTASSTIMLSSCGHLSCSLSPIRNSHRQGRKTLRRSTGSVINRNGIRQSITNRRSNLLQRPGAEISPSTENVSSPSSVQSTESDDRIHFWGQGDGEVNYRSRRGVLLIDECPSSDNSRSIVRTEIRASRAVPDGRP